VWSSNRARHRLSGAGNRQLNAALHRIALTRAHWHPDAKALLARRRAQGDGGLEALRILKRRLSDVVYRALLADATNNSPTIASQRSYFQSRSSVSTTGQVSDGVTQQRGCAYRADNQDVAPMRHETNVRIPDSAWDALEVLKHERGLSRDATVRMLLAEHLVQQETLGEDERLTHISTVLRHPAPPRHRGHPPGGTLLRLRLELGTTERARAVSLRLPGQPSRRGHHDYQARLLTDAVVTAIARQQPFTDDVLDGLPPLITHQTALGLWRLAAAGSTTRSEAEVYVAAESPIRLRGDEDPDTATRRRRAQLVADMLREDTAWHDPRRQMLVVQFARKLLTGTDAAAHQAKLHHQGREWDALRHDLENRTDFNHCLFAGMDSSQDLDNLEGRGGTAVWRAQRKVVQQDLDRWIMQPPVHVDERAAIGPSVAPREFLMCPPGWLLQMPDTWHALVWRPSTTPRPLGEPWASHVAARRVLRFEAQNRQVLWPVTRLPSNNAHAPVPGFNVVLNATTNGDPRAIIESVLVLLTPDTDEHYEFLDWVRVPAPTAHKLDLVDRPTRDVLIAEAREKNIIRMRAALAEVDKLPRDVIDDYARSKLRDAVDDYARSALGDAVDKLRYFSKIVEKAEISFTPSTPTWHWQVRSVADEVERGGNPAALAWLARWAVKAVNRGLQQSMNQAWQTAFERFRPAGESSYVTSTMKLASLPSSKLVSELDDELEPPF
jgi:hypothetical protein